MFKFKDGRLKSPSDLTNFLKSFKQVTVRLTMFSFQILSVDWYREIPIKGYDYLYSEFRGCETFRVPVIRIIGKTSAGQTACLHVHGVYPYLLLRWKDVFPGIDVKDSHKYLQELALEIDKALHVASRKSASSQHRVFKISVEKKRCFYGYHRNEENFLKVYFYEPHDVTRSSELLANGAIRNKSIQPHHAHFPFTFQFMVDFNLSGMDDINVSLFKFRASKDPQMSEPSPQETQSSLRLLDNSHSAKWNVNTLNSSQIHDIPKNSTCELELDCCFNDILYKSEVAGGENPGIASIWAEERLRRKIENDTSLMTPVASQDRVNAFETESEIRYKGLLQEFLKRNKPKCDNQSEEVDTFFHSGSQNSFLHSSGSINLSNTQDQQLLGDLLSMANNNGPENDSILGFVVDSDSEDETIAMSQKFVTEPWTPQIIGSQVLQEYNSVLEKEEKSKTLVSIPQLDGTYDDDSYEEFGPMLFKEEKESCTVYTASNAVTEFDDEPPVLQPEQPLEIQNASDLQKSRIIKCSVKMENHPILKNLDPTKPILLASLEENSSCLSFEESTGSSVTYNSDIKGSKSYQNVCKKSQKFDFAIKKCLSSVISKVEKQLDRESQRNTIPTSNTVFKYSEVHTTNITSSTTETPKLEQQCASKSRFAKNCTADVCSKESKSSSKKSQEMNSLKNKPFSWHTRDKPTKDIVKSSFDKTKQNNGFMTSSKKSSTFKNDSLEISSSQRNLVNETKMSKLPSAKLFSKSSSEVEKVLPSPKSNDCVVNSQDGFFDLTTNLTKKNKLSKHKSAASFDSVTKGVIPKANTELKTVNSAHTTEDKTFPLYNNSLISNGSEIKNYQSLNLNKLGNEVVILRKMTKLEIDNLTKLASKERVPNSTDLQKADHRKKSASVVSDVTAKYPSDDKLTSERKIAKVSKKFKNSMSSLNNNFVPKTLEPPQLNNKPKHSSLSLLNKDDTDFKNPFNVFSPNKHNKIRKANRLPSNNEEKSSKNSSHSRKKFPCLDVSAKPFEKTMKRVIEEQVKFSLEEKVAEEYPEVTILDELPMPSTALKNEPELVDITSDEEDILTGQSIIPEEYKDHILHSLKVNLVECSDLIKKYCPDEFSRLFKKHQRNKISGNSKNRTPKVQFKSEPKLHSSLQESSRPKIKCEKEETPQVITPSDKPNQHLESIKTSDTKLLYAVKSEPLAVKETPKTKANWNFNSTIDANLLSSNILPYAVKSKPAVKFDSHCNINSSAALASDVGIYAVKSKPPVKTITCGVMPSKNASNGSNLPFKKSCSHSKLQTKNRSILKSDRCCTESMDSDFRNDALTTPQSVISKKRKFPHNDEKKLNGVLGVDTADFNKTKNSSCSKNPVVTDKNNHTPTSKMSKKKKEGFDFKSSTQKNSESVPNKIGFHIKEKPAMKSCSESMVANQNNVVSVSPLKKSSSKTTPSLNAANFQNQLLLKGSKKTTEGTLSMTEASSHLFVVENDLYDIVKRRTASKNNCIIKSNLVTNTDKLSNSNCVEKPFSNSKPSRSAKKSATDSKCANVLFATEKTDDHSTSMGSIASDNATEKLTDKNNFISKTCIEVKTDNEKMLLNGCVEKIIPNSKSSRNAKTSITNSKGEKTDLLSFPKKTDGNSVSIESIASEKTTEKLMSKNNCISKTNMVGFSDKLLNSAVVDNLLLNCKSSRSTRKSSKCEKTNILPFLGKTSDDSTKPDSVTSEKGVEKLTNKNNCISKTNMVANTDVDKLLQNTKPSKCAKKLVTSSNSELSCPLKTGDHSTNLGTITNEISTEKQANNCNSNCEINMAANTDEMPNNVYVEKLLSNSKSPKSVSSYKDPKLSFHKENDDQYTSTRSLSRKEATKKLNCNLEVNPSIDEPIVSSKNNSETLTHSDKERTSIQTRNKSSHKDSTPNNEVLNNHADVKSKETTISTSILGSQASNVEDPISPLSLVPKEKKKTIGNELNNFTFFSKIRSKRRRGSPESSMASKPLSSKLSLKLGKTKISTAAKVTSPLCTVIRRNGKMDKSLLTEKPQATLNPSKDSSTESIGIKKEPLDENSTSGQSSDMIEALSCFDFDENASSEPASSLSYISRRNLRNKAKAFTARNKTKTARNGEKASAVESPSKSRKHKKSSRKQKHSSNHQKKSAKISTRWNIPSNKNEVSDANEIRSPNLPIIQKFKILRSSAGHIVVPNNESESLSGYASQSPEKIQSQGHEDDYNSESEDEGKEKGSHPQMKMRIKKIGSISEECEEPKFECIFLSDSDSSKEEDSEISQKMKKRRDSAPQISPCEPLILPVPIKNIKIEKIDDYEQPSLKLNFRKKENEFYVCNSIPFHESVSNVNPSVSSQENEVKVAKRGRGRPRKGCKNVSPLKNETPTYDNRITCLPVLKKSPALPSLEINKQNSFQPLGRKTRSNSARASARFYFSDIKIKQEPISDEEFAAPSSATPEMQTSIKTRRKSLQCESFTKFFESKSGSESDESNTKRKSPKKKRSQKGKTKSNFNESSSREVSNYKASSSLESGRHILKIKSPTKKTTLNQETKDNSNANTPRTATKRRASATSSYTKYYDSDSDDDCQIVSIISPAKRSTRRRRSSSAKKRKKESCAVAQDSSKDKNFRCQVVMERLLPSEIEKHCFDHRTVNMDESVNKFVPGACAISDVALPTASKLSFDKERLPYESLQQRVTSVKEQESVFVLPPTDTAAMKLIPDTLPVSLRKFSSSLDPSTETLEKTLQENMCVQLTTPPVNIDTIAQPGNLLREPSSQVEGLTTVSSPENRMTEDMRTEAEKGSTYSPGIHKGSAITFEEGWDSPPGRCPLYRVKADPSLVNNLNKPVVPGHSTESNQVNIESACSSETKTSTVSEVAESSITSKNCNEKDLFDKIPEGISECVQISNNFCPSVKKICYPGENLLSSEPRSLIAPQNVITSDKPTCGMHQTIKPLRKEFERAQSSQTVSCFKGYDLQSEAGIISPTFTQKGSTRTSTGMLDMPTQESSDYSFLSDNFSCPMEVRKPYSICNPQINNKHGNSFNDSFFNSYNTSRTLEDFTSMQLETNPFSTSSYLEDNRSPNFSSEQSKYSNSFSNAKTNLHTNNAFNSTDWDNFNTSFCPIESFREKDMPSNISVQKKLDNEFAGKRISNSGFFSGAQFGDANDVHVPNYFAPAESERIWSPKEQVKCDNTFERLSEMPSPDGCSDSLPRRPSPSEAVQVSQFSEHASGLKESDYVGNFCSNSPSMLPSQLTDENKSSDIMSPYYASSNASNKVKDDYAFDSFSASLSDVLAGSPLDLETDSLNCDAFTSSIANIAPESVPQGTETQSYPKNESPLGDNGKVTPVNKCDKPELSHLTATSFRSLDFSDFTDDTEMGQNLFGEIAYTHSPDQSQSFCEADYDKTSENNVEHCTTDQIKTDNLLLTEAFPSIKTDNTINTSESYKVPFENNIIPLVTLNTPPSEGHFTQLPLPNFNSTNHSFLSTMLVGESVMVPQSNIFLNNASVITSSDSPSPSFVDILPNSEPITINSRSTDSEVKGSGENNSLKQSFDGSEDILSMIVKSCAIGEEFDENLDSPAENLNEVNNCTSFDSKIDSFYGDNTQYDFNQANAETFCSNLQNLNRTCEVSTSSISESKEPCLNKNSSHHSDFSSSHLSVSSDKFKKSSIPSSKKQHLAYCDKTVSSNNYAPYPKTKRKRNSEAFSTNYEKPFSEDLPSSDGVKSRDKKETSYCHSSKPNCNSQLQSRLQSFSSNLVNSNFLSGDNLESTPTVNRHESRNFISKKLNVSPINKDNLLTSDTKRPFEMRPVKSKKLFNGPEKDTAEGSCSQWYWENPQGTDRFKDFGENLSKSDLDGPTLENSRGFKLNADEMGDARVRHEAQHLTIMSLEIHVNTRNDLNPDPRFDSVAAIFYSIYKDVGNLNQEVVGIIAVDDSNLKTNSFCSSHTSLKNFLSLASCVEKSDVCCVKDEHDLFQKLINIVKEWDPDFLVGYEIQMASWGYLIERAGILNMNLTSKLSRLVSANESKLQQVEQDSTVTDQTADLDRINIPGRIVLNLWRLLRKEINLNIYSFENVYFHLLHKRTPSYTFQDLTNWFNSGAGREAVVRYYATRVVGCLQFLDKMDLIRRTSEMARLFGIQFYEVLSRGSQYRVESMMLRSASPMRYVPVTPSVQQRSRMKAPETVPLILEPESKYYKDPVLVLDFQSLYPSMIIAYNYCFSTCLGRVEHLGKEGSFDFGCTSFDISPEELHKLAEDDNIHFSPNGVAFVKQGVRRGVLPTMLKEILDTRVMVKMAMKKIRGNPALKKLLDARQLGLKLIANVTYGYTAANFSGRMPCVEVADSIVAKGRETLERAIRMIEENPRWNARAIYGDTDSIFVLLSGRTIEEAFKIGQEIVEAVNAVNPKPVKLKLEKVYHRCVLQSKKRYVGFMYETVDQAEPIFDAKGIETVRRDSCPATAKILEKALKTLFRTDNVNLVQRYVQKQFRKLLAGRVNMTDLIFAKEYRGMAGYRPTACVPALEITKKRLTKDPRSEPRSGERVPYVVVYGFPGMPIIKLVHEPLDLLKDPNLRINTTYYITRVISPPLGRVFSLLGCDVRTWYNNLDHSSKLNLPTLHHGGHQRETITQYFVTRNCPSCEEHTSSPVCSACRRDPQGTLVTLQDKIRKWERTEDDIKKVCTSCTKSSSSVDSCASIDCPILFKLNLAKRDCSQIPYLRKVLAQELF